MIREFVDPGQLLSLRILFRPPEYADLGAALINKVEVLRGEIAHIDTAQREVAVNGRLIGADHLVVALGAELAPELIPGLAEADHNFYTLPGAESLRDSIKTFRRFPSGW